MKIALVGFVLSVSHIVLAEDFLVSRRHLAKRDAVVDNFNITVFHVNDVHAHLDEIKEAGTDCVPTSTAGCFGGYARIKGEVDARRARAGNSLFLNMGDEFQGTLFFSFYGGEKIAETLNQLDFDALTLGNHEFDRGDEYLGTFLKNLTFPIVCANVQSSDENVNSTVKPYQVFPQYSLAVVAVTTDTIPQISSPNPDTLFSDPVSTAQYWSDYVKVHEGVERVILMTHIGYEEDIRLAQQTRGIYAIFGGHSHTLLGDMAGAEGKYPTIVDNMDGEEVFIVTAWRYGVYLGYINLQFDSTNRVVAYTGGPIHLDNTTIQDSPLQKQVKEWRGPFEEYTGVVIGKTTVALSDDCQTQECLLGDVVCDAMLEDRLSQSQVDFCMIGAGNIRATIGPGNVTRGDVLTAFPFGSTLVEIKLAGEDLWKVFEGVFSRQSMFNDRPVTSGIQVSRGIRMVYNPMNPIGSRLVSLEVGQDQLRPVDKTKVYTIVTVDFLAGGGDNIIVPALSPVALDALSDVLIDYIHQRSPLSVEIEGRIFREPEIGGGQAVVAWE